MASLAQRTSSSDDSDCEGPPTPKKPKNTSGTATYGTKYNPEWERSYPFVHVGDLIQFLVSTAR